MRTLSRPIAINSEDLAEPVFHHLVDSPTAVFVGASSSQSKEIANLLDGLKLRLSNCEVLTVCDSFPRPEAIPYDRKFDQVVGIGGGKVMDCAKIASLSLPRRTLIERLSAGQLEIPRQSRLICIPTTTGSGSEATHFCVCYLGSEKYSIAHPTIEPDVALLCPSLLRSLSSEQFIYSSLDAICQAVESIFSIGWTSESISYSQHSLSLGLPILLNLHNTKPNAEEMAKLQLAAHYAGKAINIAKTNVPHALSYYLSYHHKVPHGLAVSIFFEKYLQMLARSQSEFNANQQQAFTALCSELCASNQYLFGSWSALLRRLSMPGRLEEISPNVDKDALLGSVNLARLRNFPFPLELEQLVLNS